MTNESVILAFDTSNYTTSVAIMNTDGKLIANLKKMLPVKTGERGLRQSEALFHHTVNIPELMRQAEVYLADKKIIAVGVSDKPRNQEGSYMPCFLAGLSAASAISSSQKIPLYRFSHQCGHIMAALYSSDRVDISSREFAAFHISGGTTELVRAVSTDAGFNVNIVMDTADLNAGQVIDRVGVHMGLAFPAGPELEKLAKLNDKKIPRKKISISSNGINLSGLENMAVSLYKDTNDSSLTAAFVFDYLGRAISAMCEKYTELYGKSTFIFAGGVMCNSIIRRMLSSSYEAYFAEPAMSADNAVGIAALALRAHLEKM